MNIYTPTMDLRFVMREVREYFGGGAFYTVRHDKILQQRFVSDLVGSPPQWRDVPLIDAAAAMQEANETSSS
jgi:hypothetical protein